MLPNAEGRFCNNCNKSVVDFTAMTDEEVQGYFINNQGKGICGRFKNDQIHRIVISIPENILRKQIPLWMRFLVACLVIFGLSLFPFETTIAGKTERTGFYQGEPVQAARKSIKKKKKKKNKIALTKQAIVEPVMSDVLGYTVSEERVWLPDLIYDHNPETTITSSNNISPDYPSDEKQPVPKKVPAVPDPLSSSEFILPAVLIRKGKEKGKGNE